MGKKNIIEINQPDSIEIGKFVDRIVFNLHESKNIYGVDIDVFGKDNHIIKGKSISRRRLRKVI